MSDLQILLIVIGALIICAVVIINWWQERRFHKQVENSFSTLKSDALLDDPKLDINSVYQNMDDADVKDFSIKREVLDEPVDDLAVLDSFIAPPIPNDVFVEEESTIDAVYTQLEHTKFKSHADANPDFIDPDLGLSKNPAQHDDIKAIFSEAFSQTTNTASS